MTIRCFRPNLERLEHRALLTGDPLFLADINQVTASSNPADVVAVGDLVYFTAEERPYARELWRSDGTAAGTFRIRELLPDLSGLYAHSLTAVADRLYFSSSDFPSGQELWTSDGTVAGTRLVKDINPDDSSGPDLLTNVAGTLFFVAGDTTHGRELWKSDGTEAGTVRVADIRPGRDPSDIGQLTAVGDTLYFTANNGTGRQLWKSDGTEAGTVIVRPIDDSGRELATLLTCVGNRLFFVMDGPDPAFELWTSDGTQAGTLIVQSFSAGGGFWSLKKLADIDGTLYFLTTGNSGGLELWTSDGTPDGTAHVQSFGSIDAVQPLEMVGFAGNAYFPAYDPAAGVELWRSDGTPEGTFVVADISPRQIAEGSPLGSYPMALTPAGDRVYFFADDGVHGRELWITNGTAEATSRITDLEPTQLFANRAAIGGTLFFVANDGQHGDELWKSDGAESSTTLVKDIRTHTLGSDPGGLTNVGDLVFFTADDGIHGSELWRTDGTTVGTFLVKDILVGRQSSFPGSVLAFRGAAFFTAIDPDGNVQVWKSNGTESGTIRLTDFAAGANITQAYGLTPAGDALFFAVHIGNGQAALWKTDGTPAGTTRVKDLYPNQLGGWIGGLWYLDGQLFFASQNPSGALEWWKSDGTENGTVRITDFFRGLIGGAVQAVFESNGTIFLAIHTRTSETQLWKSDGTEAGTSLVYYFRDISEPIHSATSVHGVLYFVLAYELWRSDGTETGTYPVAHLLNGGYGWIDSTPPIINGSLIFATYDAMNRPELRKIDPALGDVSIKTFSPEENGIITNVVGVVDERFYFLVRTPDYGYQLWSTDGTTQGTVLVHSTNIALNDTIVVLEAAEFNGQIVVGYAGESGAHGFCQWGGPTLGGTNPPSDAETCQSLVPRSFHSADGTLYFTRNDGLHGNELWIQRSMPTGDFDHDGDIDDVDIDRLHAAIRTGAHDAAFDLTGDSLVDSSDAAHLVTEILGTRFGDADLDRSVGRGDIRALVRNFGRADLPGWAAGDFNGDGRVELRDLALAQLNVGVVAPSAASAAVVDQLARGPALVGSARRIAAQSRRARIVEPRTEHTAPTRLIATRSVATDAALPPTEPTPRTGGRSRRIISWR